MVKRDGTQWGVTHKGVTRTQWSNRVPRLTGPSARKERPAIGKVLRGSAPLALCNRGVASLLPSSVTSTHVSQHYSKVPACAEQARTRQSATTAQHAVVTAAKPPW